MPDDLVAPEGVDEGSAASATEGDAGPSQDAVGPPAKDVPPVEDEAPPVPMGTRSGAGPGQELQEGEG